MSFHLLFVFVSSVSQLLKIITSLTRNIFSLLINIDFYFLTKGLLFKGTDIVYLR